MSVKIFASQLSPFSARLRIACALKGLNYSFEPPPGGSGSAEFTRITPFGRIPALIEDQHVLVESLALLEYLEDANPEAPSLRPADAVSRARVRMIALLFDHNIVKSLNGVFAQLMKPSPDIEACRIALNDVETELAKLVLVFDQDGPCVGGRWSIADCAIAPFAFLIDTLSPGFGVISPTQRVPRFAQWWSGFSKLTEVVEATERMQNALAAMMAAKMAQVVV